MKSSQRPAKRIRLGWADAQTPFILEKSRNSGFYHPSADPVPQLCSNCSRFHLENMLIMEYPGMEFGPVPPVDTECPFCGLIWMALKLAWGKTFTTEDLNTTPGGPLKIFIQSKSWWSRKPLDPFESLGISRTKFRRRRERLQPRIVLAVNRKPPKTAPIMARERASDQSKTVSSLPNLRPCFWSSPPNSSHLLSQPIAKTIQESTGIPSNPTWTPGLLNNGLKVANNTGTNRPLLALRYRLHLIAEMVSGLWM